MKISSYKGVLQIFFKIKIGEIVEINTSNFFILLLIINFLFCVLTLNLQFKITLTFLFNLSKNHCNHFFY